MQKAINRIYGAGILVVVALLGSCQKDNDITNWSPTQALPADTTDLQENPTDTTPTLTFPFQWQAVIIGDESFYGDSTTFQHAYDSLAQLHEFSCFDQYGRKMILRMPDVEIGTDTLSFNSSSSIELIDDTLTFNTSFNPNGYISIYSNSNGKISALFEADLNDIAGSGQDKELVNGMLQNVRFQ